MHSRSTATITNSPREKRRSNTEAEVDEPSSDENEMPDNIQRTPSTPKVRGREKTSLVWNHFYQSSPYTCCKHCSKRFFLKGSTSTALHHIKDHHYDKLSEAEKLQLQTGGLTSSDASLPKRSTNRKLTDDSPDISHYSLLGRRLKDRPRA